MTPEQAVELFHYHSLEPFGEVRQDLRMAHLMKFYYDGHKGKSGVSVSIGKFTMYEDLIKEHDDASHDAFLRVVGG